MTVNLDVSPEDAAFREAARTWLRENFPTEPRPHSGRPMREWDLGWQRAQWEGGWAGASWPVEYGGRGLSLVQQMIWFEEYGKTGAESIPSTFVGNSHAGPTLMANGTEEQKGFHLPKILRGEVVWCQGFSEPNAGSDLASLRTVGRVEGDELVVSGQKVWTSFADQADFQELLIRTTPGSQRHHGLTWVICDMSTPGITVRPIRTIEHGQEFCEVFYDDVRLPVANVVGDVGDGWRVAMSTLSFERGTAFTIGQVQLADTVERLVELAHDRTDRRGRPLIADDDVHRKLATARAEVAALRAMTYATISANAKRAQPGPEGSMVKVYYTELHQRVERLAAELLGRDILRWVHDSRRDWQREYLKSYSLTIGGGTSEIQRNIIGERVLGLPR